MTTLDAQARQEVATMIQAALQSQAKGNAGLTRGGTVLSYEATSRVAQVIIDGDAAAVPIQNALAIDLQIAQRVLVAFQEPHGATILGVSGTVIPPAPAPTPPFSGVKMNYVSGTVEADYAAGATIGPAGCGTYVPPVNGVGLVHLVVQGRFVGASSEDVIIQSANADMPFTAGTAAGRGIAAEFTRTNLSVFSSKSLTGGVSWSPQFQVVVGAGGSNWHWNFYEAAVWFFSSSAIL